MFSDYFTDQQVVAMWQEKEQCYWGEKENLKLANMFKNIFCKFVTRKKMYLGSRQKTVLWKMQGDVLEGASS